MKPITTRSSTFNIHKFYLLFTQCFHSSVELSQQTRIFSLDSIKPLVLLKKRQCVYCEVEREPLQIMNASTHRLTYCSGMKEIYVHTHTHIYIYICCIVLRPIQNIQMHPVDRTSGRVKAQAVSPRLLTGEARFDPSSARVRFVGTDFCFSNSASSCQHRSTDSLSCSYQVNVKQFLQVPSRLRLPDSMTISEVVSPTHRPPLPPGNIPAIHFC